MTKQTFIIKTDSDLTPCIEWIKIHLVHAPLEVTISTQTRGRSANQHRLYWQWVTEMANHIGLFKDEVHEMLKRKFAVPIFERDNEDYAEMVRAVKAVRKEGKAKEAEAMARMISRLTSTTDFTVEEMKEYMDDVSRFGGELGVHLTFPEEG